MESPSNHYQFLGLDMSADVSAVKEALDRFADEADTLAYTSPEQSQQLWRRIRQIKRDLLSGSERRYAYDRTLLSFLPETANVLAEDPSPRTRGTIIRTAAPVAARRRLPNPWLRLVLGTAVALFLALLGTVVLLSMNRGGAHIQAVAGGLRMTSAPDTSGYPSGQAVTLQWNHVNGATRYAVQVATRLTDPSDQVVFSHNVRRYTTSNAHYTLKVVGPQYYYWRVSAYSQHVWGKYTPSQHFLVAKPSIGIPVPVSPPDGTRRIVSHMTLCWSAVPGAVAYTVRIERAGTVHTNSRCTTVAVHPGTYQWSVASVVRGAGSFTGVYSQAASFTVLKREPPKKPPRTAPTRLACTGTCGGLRFSPPIACAGNTLATLILTCEGGIDGQIRGRQFTISVVRGSVREIANGGGTASLYGSGTYLGGPALFAVTATDPDPGTDTVVVTVTQNGSKHTLRWTCVPSANNACIEVKPAT